MELQTILIVIIFTAVTIIMAYYMTALIGKKSNQFFTSREVKVLERAPIGFQSNITIVQVRGNIYILLFQNKRVEIIDTVKVGDWNAHYEEVLTQRAKNNDSINIVGFDNLLINAIKKIKSTSSLHKKDDYDEKK